MFYSQVKGTAEMCGWKAERLAVGAFPADGIRGDVVVIDAMRDLEKAWAVLDAVKPETPWLVLVCHQHVYAEVAEEALRRGATEAVRRGAFLSRLAQRLGAKPPVGAPFVGEPPKA
jgi:hypothetical protein